MTPANSTPTPTNWGPNKKQVVLRKLCLLLIPPGTGDPLNAAIKGLQLLSQPGNTVVKDAVAWVDKGIAAIRAAPSAGADNPYRDADEEVICEAILKRIAAKHSRESSVSKTLAKALENYKP